MLILVGTNDALLEGLAQLLAGAGHRVRVAHAIDEAEEIARQKLPQLVIVDRQMAARESGKRIAGLPLAPGGAVVLYRTTSDQGSLVALPHTLARLTLADLELPLERQRLIALAQYVAARARESGRTNMDTPTEERHAP